MTIIFQKKKIVFLVTITIVFHFQSEKQKRLTTIRPFDKKRLANRIVIASNR